MGPGSVPGLFPGKLCRCVICSLLLSHSSCVTFPRWKMRSFLFPFQFLICVRIYCFLLGEKLNPSWFSVLVLEFTRPYCFLKKENKKQLLFLFVFICSWLLCAEKTPEIPRMTIIPTYLDEAMGHLSSNLVMLVAFSLFKCIY